MDNRFPNGELRPLFPAVFFRRSSGRERGFLLKIQESAENYLEAILMLQQRHGSVRSVDVANELSFTKPSVSVAMKNLRENGYIVMDGGHITLTESGRAIAESVYERHMLFSDWLMSLGVSRDTAVEDACRIEHVISKESFEAIKRHAKGGRT